MKNFRPGGVAAPVVAVFVAVVVVVALLGYIAVAQEDPKPEDAQAFSRGELVIETASGPLPLAVEIARTNEQRSQGLMFRTQLDQDSGMIFLYESSREISMWMKNTILSLDMIFIGEEGKITRIVAKTTPMSEATISSRGPVRAVLELVAGAAKRLAIKPGDRVLLDGLAP